MIPVEDDGQSAFHAARPALMARYGHLILKFAPASLPASAQHEASWSATRINALPRYWGLTTSHASHQHGRNYFREGVSLTMSSPASRSSAEAACVLAAVPVGVSGKRLPLRAQRDGANARQWVPPDPEILRRVKAALARI
jgi:hypothetical protein